MAEQSLQITFANPSTSAAADCFRIEQEPWPDDVGKTSTMQAIYGIAAATYGGRWPSVSCGGMGGLFNATLYVYPCKGAPAHTLKVSHGSVRGKTFESKIREEVIQTGFELEQTAEYPISMLLSSIWVGRCYGGSGTLDTHPAVVVDGDTFTFSKKVFASLRIRYTVRRYVYQIEIKKRLDAEENKYESVAYCIWDGGITWKDIEAPANFEEYDGDCGNGAYYNQYPPGYGYGDLSQTDICVHKYAEYPKAVEADRYIEIDYCSQEQVSDKIVERVTDTGIIDIGDCDKRE